MSRGKLQKFTELSNLSNVLQAPVPPTQLWPQPLIVELGCGRGEYSIGLAQLYPNKYFLGIDIQGERLWHGAKQALELGLDHVQFFRSPIEQLENYFKPREITELWLTFPDPFPRDKQAKKRLTSPRFLAIYQQLVTPGGLLHLKTDDLALFEYTMSTVIASGATVTTAMTDIYHQEPLAPELQIQTAFERKYLTAGKTIHYLEWYLATPTLLK